MAEGRKGMGALAAPDNLALACIDCNLHKGTKLTGIGTTILIGAEFI